MTSWSIYYKLDKKNFISGTLNGYVAKKLVSSWQ